MAAISRALFSDRFDLSISDWSIITSYALDLDGTHNMIDDVHSNFEKTKTNNLQKEFCISRK